jgi:Ala-tRNA(Pro) deacylase
MKNATGKEPTMPLRKLKEFLDAQKVKYVSITHSPAYTATEVAESTHIPGRELAKTVMVKLDGKIAMAVLPSTRKVDLNLLRESVGAEEARLATEEEFKSLFPDCETGAMPPFGNLYGMEVYVAPKLTEDEQIAFNAGSHTEVVKLSYQDFERAAKPKMVRMTE